MKFVDRLSHAWNAFIAKDKNPTWQHEYRNIQGMTSTYRMDKTPLRIGTERSILASIYNRIAIDVAAVEIRHARIDQNGRFQEEIPSNLNECLAVSANKDQTSRSFLMDVVLSMFDEGNVAIVPVDTTLDITKTNSYDIQSLRTGKIVQWMPEYIRVEVYNDHNGRREELTLPKSKVAIIENPLYQVMNEPNSTLQRLKHKLALLDATDDKQNSDKLNMIIQLPYTIKSEARMQQAEERRKQVEMQLTDSKYGIAYIDGTEKIIQMGHPIENRLIEQIEYFTNQLYAQLGLTPEVFNGTADSLVMLNYNNRTIEPIVSAIVDEMHRKFLTKTARTQGQAIVFFRAPFSLVTVDKLAEIADKFTRNEILNSNEIRALLGYKPVDTARAEELLNKNINPVANDPSMMPMMDPNMPPELQAQMQQQMAEQAQGMPPQENLDQQANENGQNENQQVDENGQPVEQEESRPTSETMKDSNGIDTLDAMGSLSSMDEKDLRKYLKELEDSMAEVDNLSLELDEDDSSNSESDKKSNVRVKRSDETNKSTTPKKPRPIKSIDKMDKKELEDYLKKLNAYNDELDELDKQVGGK